MTLSLPHLAVLALVIAGCSPTPPAVPTQETPPPAAQAPAPLAEPNVVMEANPAPPFTYWAPEGATIRNHPNVQGAWNAFVDGQNVATYFGDECRASEYQQYIGQDIDTVPTPAPPIEIRKSCRTCPVTSDLRLNRISLAFDEESRLVVSAACY